MSINYNRPIVIGIDHGFGNVKTSHVCFKTGVTVHEKEPTFKSDLLIYDGRYYTIGEEHKEFTADKAGDQDYYILTLAAIARELRFRGTTSARVYVAAGLPLTWVSEQRDSFKAYLLQKPSADFSYRGKDFHVEFAGAEIYPQGFSAVADRMREFHGVNMLCDIGNGTMNILFIRNGKPIPSQCFTEKYGVHQRMLAAWEKVRQKYGAEVDESVIEEVLRTGKADIGERYLNTIRECAQDYAEGILRRLRAHEYIVNAFDFGVLQNDLQLFCLRSGQNNAGAFFVYYNPELMKLYVMGGGSCLIRNFTEYDPARVTINSDVCATAKGYERLAEAALHKSGGLK